MESMKLLAPLAGAGLFTAVGGPAVALLDAVTFVLAAVAFVLIRVQETRPAAGPRRSWTIETAEGARYLWRHPRLRGLVLAGATAMVVSSLSSTTTYALLDGLHQPPAFAGVLTPVQGLGSVLSGLSAGALMRRVPEHMFSAAGLALFALGALARATPWLPVVLGANLAIGLGLPCPLIVAYTAAQRETPHRLLGRIAGTASTLIFAPTGLALLLGTGMVASLDYRAQILSAGILSLTVAAGLVITSRR